MTEVTYCDDWGCPARVSCARHLGRSREYWAMTMPGSATRKYDRQPGADDCPEYEPDQPRPWLAA